MAGAREYVAALRRRRRENQMPNLSKTTKDHDVIRNWAEERSATPSHVKRTGSAEDVGILRFDFPGYSGEESLEPVSWEQFFDKFDERGLVLVFEEETAGGQRSNFNKLISGGSAKGTDRSSGRKGTRTSAGQSSRSHSRRGGSTKKATSSASGRVSRGTAKKSTAKKSTASSKRTSATKKSASRPGRSGARTRAARKSAKAASRAGTKKTAAKKKTTSGRGLVARGQKKTSAKKSAKRR